MARAPAGKRVSDPTLRRARMDDLAELLALEERAFRTDRISRRSFAYLLQSPNATVIVAALSGRVAGYALALVRAHSAIGRLYSIAVAPEAAGRGVGRALLTAAEAAVRRRGAEAMRLEVRAHNRRATKLYRQSGYRPIGRREAYYEDGAAALRLEKNLLSE